MGVEAIIALVIAAIVGAALGFFGIKKTGQSKLDVSTKEADEILTTARLKAKEIEKEVERKNENIKRKKIGEAKDKFSRLKSDYEKYKSEQKISMKEREVEIRNLENGLKQKQDKIKSQTQSLESRKSDLETKESEIKAVRENLDKQLKIISKKKEELENANQHHIEALEKVANLSEHDAKEELLQAVRSKAEMDALNIIKDTITQAKLDANKEAKKIVIQSIQRMCAEYTIENTVSVFNLESDDLKGQIIGREGRNIRALEAATGAEIVVDDTPEAIIISSFDPIRREVCRLSLKRLVADGRIHPARIEEVVAKTRKELDEQIVEIGQRTVMELDIHGLNAYLVKMVGRMRFRSSYGQNLLKHSIETAHLCASMAAELGLSPKQVKLAKRGGLLHDIGKVSEEDSELPHAPLGMKICEKHGENAIICNAVGAHHDEVEMNNIISPIVQACDAISGARPGARREILESYLKRIGELEELAMAHDNVQKAYAMQAGRELRVIVESDKVSDQYAEELSFMISQKIQDEMQYPGQIKVTVIREKRAVNFAR